jgi:hypothetical protein
VRVGRWYRRCEHTVVVRRENADAVGPNQRSTVCVGDTDHLGFDRRSRRINLSKTGGKHDETAGLFCFSEDAHRFHTGCGGYRQDRHVNLRKVRYGTVSCNALNLRLFGIYRIDRPVKAADEEILDHFAAGFPRVVGRSDDGDRPRMNQFVRNHRVSPVVARRAAT